MSITAEFLEHHRRWLSGQLQQAEVVAGAFPEIADALRSRAGPVTVTLPNGLVSSVDPRALEEAVLRQLLLGVFLELRNVFEDPIDAVLLARGVEAELGLRGEEPVSRLQQGIPGDAEDALEREEARLDLSRGLAGLQTPTAEIGSSSLETAAQAILESGRAAAREVLYGIRSAPAATEPSAEASEPPLVNPESPRERSPGIASFRRRAGALFLDAFVLFAPPVALMKAFGLYASLSLHSSRAFALRFLMLAQGIQWMAMIATQYLWGQTPGKMLLGVRVYAAPGRGGSWRRRIAVRETLGRFLNQLFFGFGYLASLGDSRRRTWGDRAAGTVVLRRDAAPRARSWAAAALGLGLVLYPVGLVTAFRAWGLSIAHPALAAEVTERYRMVESLRETVDSLFNASVRDMDEFRGQMNAARPLIARERAQLDTLQQLTKWNDDAMLFIDLKDARRRATSERVLALVLKAVACERLAAAVTIARPDSDFQSCVIEFGYHSSDAEAFRGQARRWASEAAR